MTSLKKTAFFICIALCIASFNSGIILPEIFGYADEILLALGILSILVFYGAQKKITLLITIYLVYSILNSLISPFGPNIIYAPIQALIHIKVFIVALSAIVLYEQSRTSRKLVNYTAWSMVIVFGASLILNILLGETWNSSIFGVAATYRYGFVRPTGYFGHYGPNSYFFSMLIVLTITIHLSRQIFSEKAQTQKLLILSLADFLMAFPLTVRKGLFILIPYTFHVISLFSIGKKILFTFIFTALFFSAISLLSDTTIYKDTENNITNFLSDDHAYIRGLMFYHGIQLFTEFLPFGVGNGLYGSVFSSMNTSVYEYAGFNMHLITSASGELVGVYDSGVSSILAEGGLIGIILIAWIILEFIRINKRALSKESYSVFKILTTFAILLSITEPVWQNGFFTTFYTMSILYIYTNKTRSEIIKNQDINTRTRKVKH